MHSTHGRSLRGRKLGRKAMLVAMVISVLAMAAPASAAPPEGVETPRHEWQQSHSTTLGRSWS